MIDSLTDRQGLRRVATVAIIGLLVAFSGCAGFDDGALGGSPNDTGTTTANPTTDSVETTASDGHDHSHSQGSETTASDSEKTNNSAETNASGDISGKMTVAVAGNELPLDKLASGDRMSIASDDEHAWRASSDLTLSEALASFGVEAGADAVTYNGTTYREATDGTTIHYRVNGESVDPESYALQDGDQVWMTVETAEANYSIPGTYIHADQQHIHGPMEFVVEGEEIDFSAERFQSSHRHFHFEGGHANPWHAHSWSVTLQYGLNTLSGINVTEDAVTYNGTTYRRGDADATVSITVNGESVDPSEYFLKDGDDVRIVLDRDES